MPFDPSSCFFTPSTRRLLLSHGKLSFVNEKHLQGKQPFFSSSGAYPECGHMLSYNTSPKKDKEEEGH